MPRIRIPMPLAAALGMMLFVSCTNPEWVCGCSAAAPTAVLHGRVTAPDGSPVAGALVVALYGAPGCVDPLYDAGEVRTETDGRYELSVAELSRSSAADEVEGCFRAHALAPTAALRGSDTVQAAVRFRLNAAVLDSARVDLVLRAP